MYQFISLNLPRIFIRSDVFIKKTWISPVLNFVDQCCINCSCIWFRDLSKKLQISICVCVCVCVCARVCVCMYKCDKWKQFFNCHKHNTIHVFIFKMWRNFRHSLTENCKNLLLICITQNFYLLEILLHFLVY